MKKDKMKTVGQLKPLTAEEKQLVPIVKMALQNTSRKNPIKAFDLQIIVNEIAIKNGIGLTLNAARLRKVINHLRAKKEAYIISGSFGYYISKDEVELENMILSLETRAASIVSAANGLRELLEEIRFEKQNSLIEKNL